MRLYFARHGHNDANEQTAPDPRTGEVDEPLNTVGIQQAQALAEELADTSFDVIISSPLKRALETAEIVNSKHDLPIEVDAVWREREIGGHVSLDVWLSLFNFDTNIAPKNGESLRDFFDRVYGAIDDLKQKYADKTVLIVAHGGVHLALYAYVNKLDLVGNLRLKPLDNCEYKIYEIR